MAEKIFENKTITIQDVAVKPGENKLIKVYIDRLPTGTEINIPVYVFNGLEAGPTVLIQGGLHGDELNGTELIRRMLANDYFQLIKGAAIVIPLLNVFGFIHFSREVHGKDVNRKFPGNLSGSMASRIAHFHMNEIVPHIDFGIDCHTGGDQRTNYPQIRYTEESAESKMLADVFNAPINFSSSLIQSSFRQATYELDKHIIVYEGGESLRLDEFAINEGIRGILNVLHHFDMTKDIPDNQDPDRKSIGLYNRKWIRAETSGVFRATVTCGIKVEENQVIASITDTYGESNLIVKASFTGYILGLNNFPVVNSGDPLFHIGKEE